MGAVLGERVWVLVGRLDDSGRKVGLPFDAVDGVILFALDGETRGLLLKAIDGLVVVVGKLARTLGGSVGAIVGCRSGAPVGESVEDNAKDDTVGLALELVGFAVGGSVTGGSVFASTTGLDVAIGSSTGSGDAGKPTGDKISVVIGIPVGESVGRVVPCSGISSARSPVSNAFSTTALGSTTIVSFFILGAIEDTIVSSYPSTGGEAAGAIVVR